MSSKHEREESPDVATLEQQIEYTEQMLRMLEEEVAAAEKRRDTLKDKFEELKETGQEGNVHAIVLNVVEVLVADHADAAKVCNDRIISCAAELEELKKNLHNAKISETSNGSGSQKRRT